MTVASAPAQIRLRQNPADIEYADDDPTAQSAGNTFSKVQHSGGWGQFGQGPPNFCGLLAITVRWNFVLDGAGGLVAFDERGRRGNLMWEVGRPYSDPCGTTTLIGPGSSQGMPDGEPDGVPSLHDFTYDVLLIYGDNLGLAQALEFDINQFFGKMGFILGHEVPDCERKTNGTFLTIRARSGTPTGIACYPKSNSWNHLND